MGTDSIPKQRCGSSSRMTSDLTLLQCHFENPHRASCPKPHHLKGHWLCLKCPQELKAVYGGEWIDRWMDGRTVERATDGWMDCLYVRLCDRRSNRTDRQTIISTPTDTHVK